MNRILVTVGLAVTFALAGAPAPANAFVKAFWGPDEINGVSQFPIYKELGVDLYQASLEWPGRRPDETEASDEIRRTRRTSGRPRSSTCIKETKRHRMASC